jgi:hypothetical protein
MCQVKQSGVIKFLSKILVPIDIPAIADRLDVGPDSGIMPRSALACTAARSRLSR